LKGARHCLPEGMCWRPSLLFFQIDRLILMALNCAPNLDRRLSELGLLICEKSFLGAGGAFRSVQAFKAATQACVPQSAVAAAIAWQLIQHAGDLRCLLVSVQLPVVTELLSHQLGPAQNWG